MRRLVVVVSLLVGLSTAHADKKQPHVSLPDARKIALARVPGTVVHEKLKHKKGHDLYYIKIHPKDQKSTDTVRRVEVDSETGQIVKIHDVKAKSKSDD